MWGFLQRRRRAAKTKDTEVKERPPILGILPFEKGSWYEGIMRLVEHALEEDIRTGDITSEACIDRGDQITGRLILKQGGRLAGLPILAPLFNRVDPQIQVKLFVDEGSEHQAGTVIGVVSGSARGIFSADRVALNFLTHASGIATVTSNFVDQVSGFSCDILDTRKTLPGLRCLEKYAVHVGGGINHRAGLDDRFIIKRSHLAFLARSTRNPLTEAVQRVRAYRKDVVVEVEVEDLDMIREALDAKVDIIRLDHFPLPMVRRAVAQVNGRAYVEAAGGATLETIRTYAEAGVNGVSVSALTYAVPPLDISLRF